jgi:Cd2+/Zn2+-exporting ATPase
MLVRRGERWGVIAAADEPRPAAAEAVAALKRHGVEAVVLLSGDSPATVEAIARRTAVDAHYGALLPEDKVKVLGELEQRYGAVAMVRRRGQLRRWRANGRHRDGRRRRDGGRTSC